MTHKVIGRDCFYKKIKEMKCVGWMKQGEAVLRPYVLIHRLGDFSIAGRGVGFDVSGLGGTVNVYSEKGQALKST